MMEQIDLSPEDHPALLHLPLLPRASVLAGSKPQAGVSIIGMETIYFGMNPVKVANALGANSLRITCNWDITSFARLLAKIAYGFAVAQCGLLRRDQVPLLPLILGTRDDASSWLGSAEFQLAVEARQPTHAVGLSWIPDPDDPAKKLLLARLKLFVPSGATGYEIVAYHGVSPAA